MKLKINFSKIIQKTKTIKSISIKPFFNLNLKTKISVSKTIDEKNDKHALKTYG